jgi:hypothetical protein
MAHLWQRWRRRARPLAASYRPDSRAASPPSLVCCLQLVSCPEALKARGDNGMIDDRTDDAVCTEARSAGSPKLPPNSPPPHPRRVRRPNACLRERSRLSVQRRSRRCSASSSRETTTSALERIGHDRLGAGTARVQDLATFGLLVRDSALSPRRPAPARDPDPLLEAAPTRPRLSRRPCCLQRTLPPPP